VTSAQLRAWRAFKLAKSRTYHSLAEECGALSLFLATAAAASQQQEEAAKKSSSRSAQLVPGSMPTVDELRAYGAYKRLHGLNFDGDPKAEAKALHMWFKTLWGGSSGSSNRSSSTTSTSSLGTSSGMEGAPPRRMKPQLADTGSSSWSDESNLPPLVGNAPNSPVRATVSIQILQMPFVSRLFFFLLISLLISFPYAYFFGHSPLTMRLNSRWVECASSLVLALELFFSLYTLSLLCCQPLYVFCLQTKQHLLSLRLLFFYSRRPVGGSTASSS
jgi:hypothetical protein